MSTLDWKQPSPAALKPFFSPALIKKLAASKVDTSAVTFADHVNNHAATLVKSSLEIFPSDTAHFLQMVQPLVNPNVLSQVSQNLADFDKLAGIPCSESFIQQRLVSDWLKELSCTAFEDFSAGAAKDGSAGKKDGRFGSLKKRFSTLFKGKGVES
jgi:hypothetical protein